MDFEIKNVSKLLYGGDENIQLKENSSSNTNDTATDTATDTNTTTMEVYYPKMTRGTLSIYEYVGVITKLAKYLNSLTSLDKYLSDIEVNQIINPSELAFNLSKALFKRLPVPSLKHCSANSFQ